MRILIIGKTGQLGKSIKKITLNNHQHHEYIFTDRTRLDLSNKKSITSYFESQKFDVVVNCAAYTAVDKAENEKELPSLINYKALKHIAKILTQSKTKLIHVSTDYVFDGESEKPYNEKDTPNPVNVYGETKLAGENVIQKFMPTNAIIIRAGWIYSEYDNNFLDTILKLGKEREELSVVYDQIGSPTSAELIADITSLCLYRIAQEKNSTQNS